MKEKNSMTKGGVNKMHLIRTVRTMFVLFCTVSAFIFCSMINPESGIGERALWGLAGFILSLSYVFLESRIEYILPREILVAMVGLILGLMLAQLVIGAFPFGSDEEPEYRVSKIILNIVLSYIGLTIALRYSDRITFTGSRFMVNGSSSASVKKLLDTSVLIDGRISDIVETGFVEGPLLIPSFVLRELQTVADSSDPIKRKRGRRGLDVVKRLQEGDFQVEIVDEEPGNHRMDVDEKLVLLGKDFSAAIMTNDFNLNKVATIQDIQVLNINDLSNALRPVVLPGENMSLFVLKEGKEPGQGIGYLDDGTMVVVDEGIHYLSQKTNVQVTSVLQTAAGRMIFAKPSEG